MKSDPSPAEHQAHRSKWFHAQPALLSAILAILLYGITLGGGYIYDDTFVVRDDPRVHDPHQWGRLWTTDYFDGGIDNLYRPIVSSSYAIQWWLHGDRPWMFHAVNVLLHALTAALVAEFTRRALLLTPSPGMPGEGRGEGDSVGRDPFDIRNYPHPDPLPDDRERGLNARVTALIAGLLFAAHPIHVEAVANIVGRAELACTACIFAALILICHPPTTLRRVAIILAIAMVGVLCKEQGILQPILWLFFGVLFLRKKMDVPAHVTPVDSQGLKVLGYSPPTAKAKPIFLLLTCWAWAIYLITREHFLKFEWDRSGMDATIQPLIRSAGLDRILMPVVLLGRYTALLIWPAHLSLDYGAGVIGSVARISDPYLWIGFIALSTWLIATAWCAISIRRGDRENPAFPQRFLLFCLLCLGVTYSIAGNIFTFIGTIFAERLMYLPSAFFVMIAAVLLCRFSPRWRNVLVILLLVTASARTVTAARKWNDPLALYKSSLAAQPRSIQVQLLLAKEYQNRGDHPDAAETYAEVCNMYPDYWRAWQYRCEEAMQTGDFRTADESIAHAIRLAKNQAVAELAEKLEKAEKANRR